MHLAEGMLPPSQAVAWSSPGRARHGLESPSLPTWSDAARVLTSAETLAVTPSGPIFGLAVSQGEEKRENMLINTSPRRSNRQRVRHIKEALRAALSLPDGTTVTVTELACLEEGCAPIETVIGLLRPDAPRLQYKLHKPTDAVDAEDLVQVCTAWGFDVQIPVLAPLLQEN